MSRNDGRSTRLRRRPSRTIPSLIAGILILAASVALAWLSIARLRDGTWSTILLGPRDWLTGLTWDDPSMWYIGVAAAVIGVILLLCALIPGSFSALPVRNASRADVDGTKDNEAVMYQSETVMTRRAVAHVARAQCVQIDGVTAAVVTAGNKRVHLKVQTSLRETKDLRSQVIADVRDRLTAIGLNPVPRVTASIDTRG